MLIDLLRGRCPRCRRGEIFRPGLAGFAGLINDACPVCALVYLRETGYFVGAMYVSYALGVVTVLPIAVIFAVALEWPLWAVLLVMVAQTLLSVPLFLRLSRAIWLYVDYAVNPWEPPFTAASDR